MNDMEMLVVRVAHAEMTKWGLIKQGWKINLDNGKRRAGYCAYNKKVISLSRHFIRLNIKNLPQVVDTIRHEIAHAIAGPEKYRSGKTIHHGDRWKVAAVRVGAKPERCFSLDDVNMPKGNVVANCCDNEYRLHRMPRRNAMTYRICRSCKGRLRFARVG